MLLLLFVAGVAASDPARTAYPPLLLRTAEPGPQADAPEPDTTAVIGPVTIVTVSRVAEIGAVARTLPVPPADLTATPT